VLSDTEEKEKGIGHEQASNYYHCDSKRKEARRAAAGREEKVARIISLRKKGGARHNRERGRKM